jgi:arsenate reductase
MPIQAGQPNGVEVLDEIGVPVVAEFPKRLTEEVVRATDLVITMGCGDARPTGRRYVEWSVAAPSDNPWRTSATSGTISPLA